MKITNKKNLQQQQAQKNIKNFELDLCREG